MRNPNSYGSISKMSGNRRKPYRVQITTGWELTSDNKAKQIRQTLGYYSTKKEAAIALAEYNKHPHTLEKEKATLNDLYNFAIPRVSVSDDRKRVYEGAWNKYLSPLHNRPISSILGAELQDVVDACEHGYSTKVVIRTILKHIYTYAIQNGFITTDYSQYINIEREAVQIERRVYTDEEIENLWKNKNDVMYAFTLILLHQGMRLTELRELPVGNLNMEEGTITITEAKNTQSIRTIPINENCRDLLQKSLNESTSGKLFDFNANQYAYFVKNNLNHLPYDTRHTFATKANEIGIEKVVVQRLMGHKPDSVMEQYYLHLSMETLREEICRISY